MFRISQIKMRQSKVDTWERTVLNDRNSNYLGTACVDLEELEFSSEFVREKNEKIVESLKGKFKKEGAIRKRRPPPGTAPIRHSRKRWR